jgi:Flp pilus assembly protein TadG
MRTSANPKLRRLRNRPGQSMVEFVLIAPMLLLLFFGLVEFARAWNIRHVITDAAREGARNMVVDNPVVTTDSVTHIIHSALAASGIDTTQATIILDDGGDETGQAATVNISYDYTLGIVRAFLGWALQDATFTIGTNFVMRNE